MPVTCVGEIWVAAASVPVGMRAAPPDGLLKKPLPSSAGRENARPAPEPSCPDCSFLVTAVPPSRESHCMVLRFTTTRCSFRATRAFAVREHLVTAAGNQRRAQPLDARQLTARIRSSRSRYSSVALSKMRGKDTIRSRATGLAPWGEPEIGIVDEVPVIVIWVSPVARGSRLRFL
jgi:hypothetical protein